MKKAVIIFFAALLSLSARADEGMWLINAISKALETRMQERGLQLNANEIYNADAPGAAVSDAVLSLDFGCTGSFISDQGLVITNHHCAYADVHALSTPEHNYLEDGFWAMQSRDERPIKGKSVFVLKKVIDVTAETEAVRESEGIDGKSMGFRKLSYIMEKKYSTSTGLEASLASMWGGSKYYMALYEVYRDVRLVAAPPVSIAAFGGDVDNWEWPQHKCDFALYRVYAGKDGRPADYSEDNVPLKPSRCLSISTSGYKPGDFTMVIGYPGRTDRYSSSHKLAYQKDISLPISNEIRGAQMEIMTSWMARDPLVRLKYADHFFGLSNVQELNVGEVLCYNRFDVLSEKQAQEREMQEWIDASEGRKARWGSLIGNLERKYSDITDVERNITYFRECMIRGSRMGIISTRISTLRDMSRAKTVKKSIRKTLDEMDMRVERDIFRYTLESYMSHVDPAYMGPWQKELAARYGNDYDSMCRDLWDSSWMTSAQGMQKFLTEDVDIEELRKDGLYRYYTDVKVGDLNEILSQVQGEKTVTSLGSEYTRALYAMREDKGLTQYPDANSTMRISYGVVGGYEPRDGVWCDWKSSVAGLLAKHDPEDYDFCLKEGWKSLLEKSDGAGMVDFLTDNDITGGNSGSPVLNARGELIGLAFDGNKESLASDTSYTPGYNKCVCVDIRFVLWTLSEYAHMDRIISEININQ